MRAGARRRMGWAQLPWARDAADVAPAAQGGSPRGRLAMQGRT